MFDFVNRMLGRKAAQAQTHAERYAALVQRAAESGDLSDKEGAELLKLAEELGIPAEGEGRSVQSDCDAMKTILEARTAAAGFEGAEADTEKAHAELKAYDAETFAISDARTAGRAPLAAAMATAEKTLREARKAKTKAAELERANAELLGIKPEAPHKAGRHLTHNGERVGCLSAMSLVALLENPNCYGNLDRYEFICGTEQDPADFAALVDAVKAAAAGRFFDWTYLRDNRPLEPNSPAVAGISGRLHLADAVRRARTGLLNPKTTLFLRWPGQSEAEFEAGKAEVAKAYAAWVADETARYSVDVFKAAEQYHTVAHPPRW